LLNSVFYADDMQANIAHADGTIFLAEPNAQTVLGLNLSRTGTLFTRHQLSGRKISVQEGLLLSSGEKSMMVQHTIMPSELNSSDALVVSISRNYDAIFAKFRHDRLMIALLYLLLVCV